MLGKEKCRMLKQIRAEIARQNDIDLPIEECAFQGDCTGTCPKCDQEVRALSRALDERRKMGFEVKLGNVAADLFGEALYGAVSAEPQAHFTDEYSLMGAPAYEQEQLCITLSFTDLSGPQKIALEMGYGDSRIITRLIEYRPNRLTIKSRHISRVHATLFCDHDYNLRLTDCKSTNGTWVNGKRLETQTVLHSGDRIRFADVEAEITIEALE